MALGAFELNAQEQPTRRRRQVLRLAFFGRVEGDRRRGVLGVHPHRWLPAVERRRQQVADELVEGDVGDDPRPQPRFKPGGGPGDLRVGARLGDQPAAPQRRLVGGRRRGLEQRIDGLGPLAGGRVGQECPDFARGGDAAGERQVNAPEELGVVGRRRGGHPGLAQLRIDVPVDHRRQGGRAGVESGRAGRDQNCYQDDATHAQSPAVPATEYGKPTGRMLQRKTWRAESVSDWRCLELQSLTLSARLTSALASGRRVCPRRRSRRSCRRHSRQRSRSAARGPRTWPAA